jgi:hypothetical protein
VLGLAGISVAGPLFGAVFGLLSGAGLTISYLLGFAPTQDYEAESKPHISGHKVLASLWRAVAVGIAGIVAGVLNAPRTYWILFGLKLGLAAGTVNALVGLFSPALEPSGAPPGCGGVGPDLCRNDLAINTVLDRCVRTPSAVIASGFGHHPFAAAQRAFRYEVLYWRSSGPSGF